MGIITSQRGLLTLVSGLAPKACAEKCCDPKPQPDLWLKYCRCTSQNPGPNCRPPECIYVPHNRTCSNPPEVPRVIRVPGGGCYEIADQFNRYCLCPTGVPNVPGCTHCLPPGAILSTQTSYQCEPSCLTCPPEPNTYAIARQCPCTPDPAPVYLDCQAYWDLMRAVSEARLAGLVHGDCWAAHGTLANAPPGHRGICINGATPTGVTDPVNVVSLGSPTILPGGCCQCCDGVTRGLSTECFYLGTLNSFVQRDCERQQLMRHCCCSEPGTVAASEYVGEDLECDGTVFQRATIRQRCDGRVQTNYIKYEYLYTPWLNREDQYERAIPGVCQERGIECATQFWPDFPPTLPPCHLRGVQARRCGRWEIDLEVLAPIGGACPGAVIQRHRGVATAGGTSALCPDCDGDALIIGGPGIGPGPGGLPQTGGGIIVPSREIVVPSGCSGCGGDGGL